MKKLLIALLFVILLPSTAHAINKDWLDQSSNYPGYSPNTQPSVTSANFVKNNSAALAAVTGLTATLQAGKTYMFEIWLPTTSTSTQGIQFDLGGGGASATSMQTEAILETATTLNSSTRTTTLTSVFCSLSTATAGTCMVRGSIVVNAAGTFAPRFAQASAAATNSTVLQGAYMIVTQTN